MKIAITGGLGFIGTNLAIYLNKNMPVAELHSIDWNATSENASSEIYSSSTQCCFAEDEALEVCRNADVVVHLAATTTVQESVSDPGHSFNNNVIKTQKLLEFLRLSNPSVHFVFASTGGAIIGEHEGAIDETIAPQPVSPYGATKLAIEGMLSAYSGSFSFATTSMRFSNVYGPNSGHKSSVVAEFCKAYLKSDRLKVYGDGKQTRDYIYVDDVSQAILKVIEKRVEGVFQLGTGKGTSILDLISLIKKIDKKKDVAVEFSPPLQGEVKHNICNIALAKSSLGFLPTNDLQDGIRKTMNWFQTRES